MPDTQRIEPEATMQTGRTGRTVRTVRTGGRRRRLDPGSLATGLFFLGIGGIYLASGFEGEDILPLDVLIPVLLSGIGLVGLVLVINRSHRR